MTFNALFQFSRLSIHLFIVIKFADKFDIIACNLLIFIAGNNSLFVKVLVGKTMTVVFERSLIFVKLISLG